MKNNKMSLQSLVETHTHNYMKNKSSRPRGAAQNFVTSVSFLSGDEELKKQVSLFCSIKDMGFSEYVRTLLKRDHHNRVATIERAKEPKKCTA